MAQYIPLTSNPEETYRLRIDKILYQFRQLWNTLGFWTVDIFDTDGAVLVYGVKLIAKEYLLKQYPHISFDLYSLAENDPGRNDLLDFKLEVIEKT